MVYIVATVRVHCAPTTYGPENGIKPQKGGSTDICGTTNTVAVSETLLVLLYKYNRDRRNDKKGSRCQSPATTPLPLFYVISLSIVITHTIPKGTASRPPRYLETGAPNRRLVSTGLRTNQNQNAAETMRSPPIRRDVIICTWCTCTCSGDRRVFITLRGGIKGMHLCALCTRRHENT